MWLIETTDLVLELFATEDKRPKYAILSHRWTDEEVTFEEFQGFGVSNISWKKGFRKIERCCEQARADDFTHVWVDTCCIDKKSSSELSEAINSMFCWYRDAAVCYAFLDDALSDELASFPESLWFTRGWTLQELLAPNKMVFFDSDWKRLGEKRDLCDSIFQVTGIDVSVLKGDTSIQDYSIAERMSWASRRTTTRKEDLAYSLLGIFNVNMPMLYGEGSGKAFLRLQEEIMKISDDHSIFAWPLSDDRNCDGSEFQKSCYGLLAGSPAAFASCGEIKRAQARKGQYPYTMTNRGISITLNLTPWCLDTYLAVLNCKGASDDERMGIFLRRLAEDDQYARVAVNKEDLVKDALVRRSRVFYPFRGKLVGLNTREVAINVRQYGIEGIAEDMVYGFRIDEELLKRDSQSRQLFRITMGTGKWGKWDPHERTVTTRPGRRIPACICELDISRQDRRCGVIRLGFDFDFNPVCFLSGPLDMSRKRWEEFDKYGQFAMVGNRERKRLQQLANAMANEESMNDDHMYWPIYEGRAINTTGRNCLMQLKGDRINGLNVKIGSTDLCVKLAKSRTTNGIIWDFAIENNRRRSIGDHFQIIRDWFS